MAFGDIFKGIGDLFKTSEELAQEKRMRKRQLERSIEKSIDALGDGERQARKEQSHYYQMAKEKLAAGCESEARQLLQFSRMQERNASNYIRQKLVWTNALTQIQVAQSMQGAAACFKALAAESGINMETFQVGLDSMEDVESTIGEMNRAMTKKWEKDSLRAGESEESEGDASVEEMLKRASAEVAAENGVEVASGGTVAPGHA